jgi:hypothetical protein
VEKRKETIMAGPIANAEIEAQIAVLTAQLATNVPGTPAYETIQAQIMMLDNEISESPTVPPLFPHFFPGGGHGGGHVR